MIYGIGTDIVAITRIKSASEKHGRRFAEKILTSAELLEYDNNVNPTQFLARRFSMKEALVKALGTGLRESVTLHDFTVMHTELGKPTIEYSEKLKSILQQNNIRQTHITVSDEKEYAVAFALLESE